MLNYVILRCYVRKCSVHILSVEVASTEKSPSSVKYLSPGL